MLFAHKNVTDSIAQANASVPVGSTSYPSTELIVNNFTDNALSARTMSRSISASVGYGGTNHNNDVITVQELLNRVPVYKGGPAPLLAVDGKCGPLTIGAIRKFQQTNLSFSDGRVDPGKQTITALNAYGGETIPAAPPTVTPPTVTPPTGKPPIRISAAVGAPAKSENELDNVKNEQKYLNNVSAVNREEILFPVGKDKHSKDLNDNRSYDIIIVKTLLNKVPPENGGLNEEDKLAEDANCDQKTINTIEKFQKTAIGTLNLNPDTLGRIEKDGPTLYALNLYYIKSHSFFGFMFSNLPIHNNNPRRNNIVNTALSYVGTVSIAEPLQSENGKKIRKGWKIQREFYKAVQNNMFDFSKDTTNDSIEVKFLSDKKTKNEPIRPFNNMHWCGIFATYVLEQAGLGGVKWNGGIKGAGISIIMKYQKAFDRNKIQLGDVIYIDKPFQHHAILVWKDDKDIVTVNGNAEAQGILIKKQKLSEVDGYYNVTP